MLVFFGTCLRLAELQHMRDFSVDELTSRRSEAMLSSHHKILSLNADNDNVKIKIVKCGEGIYI